MYASEATPLGEIYCVSTCIAEELLHLKQGALSARALVKFNQTLERTVIRAALLLAQRTGE